MRVCECVCRVEEGVRLAGLGNVSVLQITLEKTACMNVMSANRMAVSWFSNLRAFCSHHCCEHSTQKGRDAGCKVSNSSCGNCVDGLSVVVVNGRGDYKCGLVAGAHQALDLKHWRTEHGGIRAELCVEN